MSGQRLYFNVAFWPRMGFVSIGRYRSRPKARYSAQTMLDAANRMGAGDDSYRQLSAVEAKSADALIGAHPELAPDGVCVQLMDVDHREELDVLTEQATGRTWESR